jgi:hypothetical protein
MSERNLASKAELADFFSVSLPTVDSWIRKGCPYEQKGSHGKPWVFDLAAVAKWRERKARNSSQQWQGGHVRARGLDAEPDIIQRRPEFKNGFRLIIEEAIIHFFHHWLTSDYARALTGLARQKGLSKEEAFEILQTAQVMLGYAFCDWLREDAFNKTLMRDGTDIDALWNKLTRDNIKTTPPADPATDVDFQYPDWLLMKPAEYVREHWPATE